MDLKITKPDKKSLQYLIVVLVVALLVIAGYFYYSSRIKIKELSPEAPAPESMEEIIESLTAPVKPSEPLSEDVIDSLTAPE